MTKINEILTIDKLLDKIKKYNNNNKELNIITNAYEFAKEKHYGKKRLTGDDYIIHPLNVANILVEIKADYLTISSALLHSVIDECNVTKVELNKKFGKEITSIVDGFNKINNLSFYGDNETMISNHQKILVGLSKDVRVIILKLADRLQDMRTLWVLDEKLQKAVAKETLDILTPIASRLGINRLKSELEDLSLRYYKPEIYFQIVERLNQTKKERDNSVLQMEKKVSNLLNNFNISHEIKGRAKSIYSIYRKLNKGKTFNEIYDLLALRVFVNTEAECYQVLGIIHSKFKPVSKRFKDYIAMPKTNMYQSLHTTVFGYNGQLYEIQIRTYEMDQVAENGIASHWSYKENGSVKANLQSAMEQKLQFFKSIMELKDEENTEEEFVNSVKKDIFNNTIYVYTPKGDVIELPNEATPIDFAYKVHSDIGDKMVGAIVNDNIVPLDYKLKNNDIIKINTNNNSIGPNKEWLNIVKTTQAKNKIKGFFNHLDKNEYFKLGENLLNKELRRKKINIAEFLKQENINKILHELKLKNIEELYINIGNNKYNPSQIINIIYNNNKTKEELILTKISKQNIKKANPENDIIIEGHKNIKANIASCCNPIPNDNIIGYITKGYGITIHRSNCPNISNLKERIVNVKWNKPTNKKYLTNLLIHTNNDKNILMDIVAKTTNTEITIKNITTNKNLYDIIILVDNDKTLDKFITSLKTIKNITLVERAFK